MNRVANYFKDIEPSKHRLLKDVLRRITDDDYDDIFSKKLLVPNLDSFIIKDAFEYFRLAIINLMSYKHLIYGNYLAWANVTSYYSLFYSMNFFLRMHGFAVVNVERFSGNNMTTLTFKIEREWNQHAYRFERYGAKHQIMWKRFHELCPNLCSKGLGSAVTSERAAWNYDLHYPSQARDDHAKQDIEYRRDYNFLDKSFVSQYQNPKAQEYWHEFFISHGIEEAGPGDYIDRSLEYTVAIAQKSQFSSWYESFLHTLVNDIRFFRASADLKRELLSRVNDAISQL